MNIDAGESFVSALKSQVQCKIDRFAWDDVPSDMRRDAVQRQRELLQPHFRGNAGNFIKARIMLKNATTFAELLAAIDKLRG